MEKDYTVYCNYCRFKIAEGHLVYPYVVIGSGRIPVSSIELAAAFAGKPFSKISKDKKGYIEDFICLSCITKFKIDKNKDKRICPHCGKHTIKVAAKMHNEKCPRCKNGMIILRQL